ncbi:MAG: agglutinin biogenesis protein MshP [Betaproteobacteria bacterium]|nr:agglutinin biogenesis protein MshP [Betaproteobacteria bacterium]
MNRRRVAGFSIVAAIFLLVILAALGAFILNVSTNQQIGSALDVQGARAYQAARAGIEWGVYQVQATPAYNFGNASTNPNTRACPAGSTSFSLTAATLSGFTVTVTCVRTPVDDAPANNPLNSPAVYTLTATACNQPSAGACPNTTNPSNLYVERRLEVAL